MAVLDKLVLVLCISTIATARTTFSNPEEAEEAQSEELPSYAPQDEANAPKTFQQLPREENADTPFIVPEPSSELKPPQYYDSNPPITFLNIPVPSTNLRAPTETLWNPEDNPVFYYELPATLTKLETPTFQYPKKYSKDVHSKEKAYSNQPKIELELIPIEEKELIYKKNVLDKKYNKLAKLQNQKELEDLKAQQAVQV